MKEKELIERIKQGDNTAFAALYDCYWQKVYNFTKLYITSNSEVNEIVQEVFVKLWETRQFLSEEKGLDGYLFIITRNFIFNVNRNHFRETAFRMTILRGMEESDSYDIEEELSAKDLKEYIDGLVKLLPERQQAVFRMSREQNLSYREIAEYYGITEKAVDRHIYLALKFLKKRLPMFILFMSA